MTKTWRENLTGTETGPLEASPAQKDVTVAGYRDRELVERAEVTC